MKLVIQAMVFGLFFAIQSNMQAAQAPEQAPAPSVTIQFIDRNGRVQKERTVLPGLFENLKKASAVIGDLAGSFGQITKIPLPIENVDPSTFILILSLIQSSNIGSMLEKIKPDQIIRLMRAVDYLMIQWPEDAYIPEEQIDKITRYMVESSGVIDSLSMPVYDTPLKTITKDLEHIIDPVKLQGHTAPVVSVAWSPDGKFVVTGSEDETARIWNATTGEFVRALQGHTGTVISVAWSPDGNYIATGTTDRTARIWNANTGELVRTLRGHTSGVNSVAWSPDSKYIITGSWDETARVWDASTGVLVHTLEGHTFYVGSVAWSPDGNYIATGSADNTARVWNARTGALIHVLEGHTDTIRSVVWDLDSQQLVTISSDDTARIWNATTGALISTLSGHFNRARSLAWRFDSQYYATGSDIGSVRVWKATTGTLEHILAGHFYYVNSIAWSPDGQKLITGGQDKTARIWDIAIIEYIKKGLSVAQALLIRAINKKNTIDINMNILKKILKDIPDKLFVALMGQATLAVREKLENIQLQRIILQRQAPQKATEIHGMPSVITDYIKKKQTAQEKKKVDVQKEAAEKRTKDIMSGKEYFDVDQEAGRPTELSSEKLNNENSYLGRMYLYIKKKLGYL